MVLPGIVALACVILTGALLVAFGSSVPFAAQGYRVTVPVAQAQNLVPGSEVEIAGVRIGKVVSITPAPADAEVALELQTRFAPLRAGAVAIARTKTLLGEGYIEIAPGPRNAAPIPDGGRLAASHVQPSVQLDQFLSAFDPSTRRRLRGLFTGLAASLAGRASQLSDSLGHAAAVTESAGQVLSTLDAHRGEIVRLISAAAGIVGALGSREGALQSAVTAGDQVLAETAGQRRALAATVAALPRFEHQLHTTAGAVIAASHDLNTALRALFAVTPLVPGALRAIDGAAPQLLGLFADLPGVLSAGRLGLPALRAIAVAAQRGLAQFYPTSRELIPFMQLFAVEKLAPLIFANTDNVAAGSYVDAAGIPHSYGSGIITVWNESVAGWVKKLPTNRQNPYPKPPDALLDTGRIGVIKSYDCRHIHNPLYLPPTGTGAPPCILQGPWTFDGETAYYPRLKPAGP
jgi:virulence factor Mce-like protein